MSEMDCDRLRERLALGEETESPEARTHLLACPACRREAARMEILLGALARDLDVEVPPELDARLRARLLDPASARPPAFRPGWAVALGLIALVSGIVSFALVLPGLEGEQRTILAGIALTWIYLTMAATAILPLIAYLVKTTNGGFKEVHG